jgi:hypothetical protein
MSIDEELELRDSDDIWDEDDDFDSELYSDEELGFEDEEDFPLDLEYLDEYFEESYLTGDSDLSNEF